MAVSERPVILDVGGGSGEWSRPYRLAGYDVRVIDPSVWPFMYARDIPDVKAHGVLLAIPCTQFAGSGARWWKGKAETKPWLLDDAIRTAREFLCVVERTNPEWWAVENPSGRLWKQVPELGKPRYTWQPWHFGTPESKLTCMWGDHNRPVRTVIERPAIVKGRVWRMPPSEDRARLRSITPATFAQAFFEAGGTSMNDQTRLASLADVLDAYMAAESGPNSASLAEWIRRYPEYDRELTDFMASWSLMTWLPRSPDAETADEETLVVRGMSVVQNLLHKQQDERGEPVSALCRCGHAAGLHEERPAGGGMCLDDSACTCLLLICDDGGSQAQIGRRVRERPDGGSDADPNLTGVAAPPVEGE